MKNILITGGLGFIGSSLVGKLISSDYSICIIDKGNIEKSIKGNPNISSWIKKFDTSSDSYFKGEGNFFLNEDLLSTNLDKLISKSDVVIHLSANPGVQLSIESPELDLKENFLSTFKLIESIRKSGDSSKKIIFSSSAAPLAGNNTMPINENLPYKPLSPYGASKASSESYLQAYANAFSLKTLILRFSNIYGPGSILKGSVVANMIKSCINKSEINIEPVDIPIKQTKKIRKKISKKSSTKESTSKELVSIDKSSVSRENNIIKKIFLIIISIIAFILLLDTFKNQISVIFPGILKMSDSLYLVINDLKLFIKDLVR